MQVLPLSNHQTETTRFQKSLNSMRDVLCDFMQLYIHISTVDFVVLTKSLFTLIHTEYLYTKYIDHYIHI